MTTLTRLTRLTRLTPRDWAELLLAEAALLRARLLVATRPAGRLVDRTAAACAPAGAERLEEAWRLARAVHRAATYGIIRAPCLVRALALHRLLEARGIRGSRIRIGVSRNGEAFVAHAWVQYGDLVLGDRAEHVGSFVQLADVRPVIRS